MREIDDVVVEGARDMALMQQWCDRYGYRWLDITADAYPWRRGICLQFAGPSGPESLLLAIEAGAPSLYVSGGVIKQIGDHGRALEAANSWTRSNPAFPCFLTAADSIGSMAIIQQQKFPLALVQDVPAFVKSSIDQMLDVLLERRANAISDGLAGISFTEHDHAYLLAASL